MFTREACYLFFICGTVVIAVLNVRSLSWVCTCNLVQCVTKMKTLSGVLLHLCFDQILDEIDEQGIKIYTLPDCESDEDEEYVEQTKQLKVQSSPLLMFFFDR